MPTLLAPIDGGVAEYTRERLKKVGVFDSGPKKTVVQIK
jgi:hypothetical protein